MTQARRYDITRGVIIRAHLLPLMAKSVTRLAPGPESDLSAFAGSNMNLIIPTRCFEVPQMMLMFAPTRLDIEIENSFYFSSFYRFSWFPWISVLIFRYILTPKCPENASFEGQILKFFWRREPPPTPLNNVRYALEGRLCRPSLTALAHGRLRLPNIFFPAPGKKSDLSEEYIPLPLKGKLVTGFSQKLTSVTLLLHSLSAVRIRGAQAIFCKGGDSRKCAPSILAGDHF